MFMYKRNCLQGWLLLLVCTVLMLPAGCGGGEKHEETEARPHQRKAHKKLVEESARGATKGTEIGGQIKEDTVLSLKDSPYVLTRNMEVLPDVKLVIEPGVVIKAGLYTAINIRGNFQAIGKEDKPIKFTSLKKNEKWDGLHFTDESFDYDSDEVIEGHGSAVSYCEIENASTGISCEKSSPLISNNTIKHSGEGIKCRNESNPQIIRNLITDNRDGIVCADYSSPKISHNTIMGDEGKGISCVNHSSPEVTYNTIFGSGGTWWMGIMCQHASAPKINHNNIYCNGGHNLMQIKVKPGEDSLDIDAKNNWWGSKDVDAIAVTISDKADKFTLGEVTFVPFVDNKIQDAGHLS